MGLGGLLDEEMQGGGRIENGVLNQVPTPWKRQRRSEGIQIWRGAYTTVQRWEFIKENKKERKKNSTKKAIKKKRKQELDQESDQNNKKIRKKTFFFSWSLFGRVLVFLLSCFLTVLFSFINSHLSFHAQGRNWRGGGMVTGDYDGGGWE